MLNSIAGVESITDERTWQAPQDGALLIGWWCTLGDNELPEVVYRPGPRSQAVDLLIELQGEHNETPREPKDSAESCWVDMTYRGCLASAIEVRPIRAGAALPCDLVAK